MDKININVYTDGACSNNGKKNAKAGMGIFFSENDSRNFYSRIEGKQTNNIAEISAILKAADILKREIMAGCIVNIYSDSEYAMRCCKDYGEKLEKINWVKKTPIPNVEFVKKAYYTFKDKPNVIFHYIAAHTGLNDIHSIGNEGADRLANLAIGQIECNSKPKKIYVKIPYEEKEHGKRLGAKWDPKKKKWYIPPTLDIKSKEMILNKWG